MSNWKYTTLRECCLNRGEYGINAAAVPYSDSLPTYLRITDIGEDGLIRRDRLQSVNDPNSRNFVLKDGDVVFARTGASVGKTYLHKRENGELVFAGFLIRFQPNPSMLDSAYLKFFTETKEYAEWLKVNSQRSGQPGINEQELGSLRIPLPPIHEQRRIARILSTWDEAIEKLTKLIELKEKRKKGLMQKLLTRELRFEVDSFEWSMKKIGEIFSFLSTGSHSRELLTYSHTKDSVYNIHYGDIHVTFKSVILDFSNVENIPSLKEGIVKGNSNDFLQDGDLVIADASEDYEGVGTCIELKNIGTKKVIGGLHTFALRDRGFTSPGFRAYLLKHPVVINDIKKIATGSKVYGISKTNLMNVKVQLPSLPEQSKIAELLSNCDSEIEILIAELAILRNQKQGMMQQLLTGKLRVKS